ncbi:MAG: MurR/RpiR family transcriptional regulator [Bosea sp. (in: a-proteobacteria)]|uniref:MurR/RpiR family transcriptional regulator n=1 Tax=Bosea sp. (in: a-proteobacteria) TaxID=1871050 RepID=UPI003F7CAEC3
MPVASFEERVSLRLETMSPAERRVANLLLEAREEALVASAAGLAEKAQTSDATVVRTVKSLGFSGMNEMRQVLAAELKQSLNIASRLTETLRDVGDDLDAAFSHTLDIHREAIKRLRRDISPEVFRAAVEAVAGARRVVIFGIGPSSAVASYLAAQLGRFGIDALCLVHTGLLFADDLLKLRKGDVLIAFAYTHVYRELTVLLDETARHGLKSILITDSLAGKLSARVALSLTVARGRADMLSLHTATLGLVEALLVGIAVKKARSAVRSLEVLNALRKELAEGAVDVPVGRGPKARHRPRRSPH